LNYDCLIDDVNYWSIIF